MLSELGETCLLDVVLPTRAGIEVRKRSISRPSDHRTIDFDRRRLTLAAKFV